MGKFDGILICTDLDGTLLKNDGTVSEENRRAIEFFKSEGGKFTFVTGRMPFYASVFYRAVRPNAPVGCINGGGLYDYEAQEYIWTLPMRESPLDLIRLVDRDFPDVGIQVNTFYKTYFCKENVTMKRFRATTGLENLVCDYAAVKEPIAKILFGCEDGEEILEMERALRAHPLSDRFDFIRSEKTLFEILPKGIGKNCAIERLSEYLHIDLAGTVAVGDYNNDVSMLRTAGLGIAVANASPEALAAADRITVSNEEHALAKVIRDLDDGIYVL